MRKLKKWITVLLSAVLLCTALMPMSATAAGKTYSDEDMFIDNSIKGMQGANNSNYYWYSGLHHSLINICLDDVIIHPDHEWVAKGFVAPYEYNGEKFYFMDIPGRGTIETCNRKGLSISYVFLVRSENKYGDDASFLIDEGSREGGHTYYAPNADLSTYGGRAIQAYWHFLMEELISSGNHIDNFILGNEVNMPNSWHYSGSTDPTTVATKYADAFWIMYSSVREYTDVSRCSICIDHSWNHNDEGRGIAAREFLHIFNDRLAEKQNDVDWCVSAHLYPALLYDSRIWNHPYGLTTNSPDTQMVDGTNLSSMTNYIREVFGEEHRVMLTEQGFTRACGEEAQAACLAYSYYAAKYDPMVDSFLINMEYIDDSEDYRILGGSLAEEVYSKIDIGSAEAEQWIADVCLPVIGVDSWEEIIPNYGQDIEKIKRGVQSAGILLTEYGQEKVVAGMVVKGTDVGDLEYQWQIYDYATGCWSLAQDWTLNNEWFTWYPPAKGDYLIHGVVRELSTGEEFVSDVGYNHTYEVHEEGEIYIKGKCQMPYTGEGGGYLIGVESNDNPNQSLQYEMLILDCTLLAQELPAWVYTTGKFTVSEGNAGWTIWQPEYGYYWTLFRVYDAEGNMLDEECYGFANAY